VARDVFTRREWDRAWRDVAVAQVEEFQRAGDEEEALTIWREARCLDAARTRLANAMAGDDDAVRAELDPINPYKDLPHD
jgi:hypothetical protein